MYSNEEMIEAFNFLNLEEVDEKEFKELYDSFLEKENDSEKIVEIMPDSKLSARSWMMAYAHLDSKNEELKEYKKILEKRYIEPVKLELEKNEKAQYYIKKGIRQFLENAEEDNIKFPDIGTFSKYTAPDTFVYPEDEEDLARKIYENEDENKDLIKIKYCFDKNLVKNRFKSEDSIPIEGICIKKSEPSVRFQRSKKK